MLFIKLYFELVQTVEKHPWGWYGPADSNTIIVGTFPPVKERWAYHFFYPNKANLFWKVLASLAQTPLQYFSGEDAVVERKQILNKLKLTVTDMGAVISRQHNSSLDENIFPVQLMDILQLLKQRPKANKIVFTSSSGKNCATRWFSSYLQQQKIAHQFPKNKADNSFIIFEGRRIELAVVHSTSPRATGRIGLDGLISMYARQLLS